MAQDIGQVIEGPVAPQQPAIPDDEVTRSPQYKKILETLSQPENLMTAIVLGAALMQPRDEGRSSAQTFAQRGLGALAFRGALSGEQRKKENEQAEVARRDMLARQQGEYQQGQILEAKAGRIQSAANTQNTIASQERQQLAGIAAEEAMLDKELAANERVARIRASAAAGGEDPFQIFTKEELVSITDLAKMMVETGQPGANGQPITFGEAFSAAALRTAGPRIYMEDQKRPPEKRVFETLFGGPAPVAKPEVTPTKETPKEKPKTPRTSGREIVDKEKVKAVVNAPVYPLDIGNALVDIAKGVANRGYANSPYGPPAQPQPPPELMGLPPAAWRK